MSHETVIALRRFTEKVAAGRRPFVDDDSAPVRPVADNYDSPTGEESVADLATPLPPPSAFAPPTPRAAPAAAGDNNMSLLSNLAGYMPSSTTSMGVLGGGLGAYGLARLLQSEESRKKNKFPWLQTLLGAAGGGYLSNLISDPAMQTQATQAYNSVAPRALRTESANANADAVTAAQEEPMGATADTFSNASFRAAQR